MSTKTKADILFILRLHYAYDPVLSPVLSRKNFTYLLFPRTEDSYMNRSSMLVGKLNYWSGDKSGRDPCLMLKTG